MVRWSQVAWFCLHWLLPRELQWDYVGSVKTTSNGNVPHLINICPTIFIQAFNVHDFSVYFDGDIQMMLRTLTEIVWYLAPILMTKSSGVKANMSNHKANRSRHPFELNCTSTECMQNSRGPPSRQIEMGQPHNRRFNAIEKVGPHNKPHVSGTAGVHVVDYASSLYLSK